MYRCSINYCSNKNYCSINSENKNVILKIIVSCIYYQARNIDFFTFYEVNSICAIGNSYSFGETEQIIFVDFLNLYNIEDSVSLFIAINNTNTGELDNIALRVETECDSVY